MRPSALLFLCSALTLTACFSKSDDDDDDDDWGDDDSGDNGSNGNGSGGQGDGSGSGSGGGEGSSSGGEGSGSSGGDGSGSGGGEGSGSGSGSGGGDEGGDSPSIGTSVRGELRGYDKETGSRAFVCGIDGEVAACSDCTWGFDATLTGDCDGVGQVWLTSLSETEFAIYWNETFYLGRGEQRYPGYIVFFSDGDDTVYSYQGFLRY